MRINKVIGTLLVSTNFFPYEGHPMARFTPTALFFFLAISHAFTLPLLRRDNTSQLQADIQLATGGITGLNQVITRATWAQSLSPVSNLQPLK